VDQKMHSILYDYLIQQVKPLQLTYFLNSASFLFVVKVLRIPSNRWSSIRARSKSPFFIKVTQGAL
jgi:hypothetical protein